MGEHGLIEETIGTVDDVDRTYRLPGPQVEPLAAFWLDAPEIRFPSLQEVRDLAEKPQSNERLRLRPEFFPDDNALKAEFAVLKRLEDLRFRYPYPIVEIDALETGRLSALSRFLSLQPQAFGTVFDLDEHPEFKLPSIARQHLQIRSKTRLLDEGSELARMFEEETPGLLHRHALNWLLFLRPDISPPRQARLWMALDMAIYAALSAAWFYKWRHEDYSRLLRPSEYAKRRKLELSVLYDEFVNDRGHDEGRNRERTCPRAEENDDFPDSPGTPRHPAWPSGHSTYSAAATYLLEAVFSPGTLIVDDKALLDRWPPSRIDLTDPAWLAAELRRLANNVGEARLWGGVHWVSDHLAGQRIGRAAAQAVINAMSGDCIPRFEPMSCDNDDLPRPTPPAELEQQGRDLRNGPCAPDQHVLPLPPDEDRGSLLRNRGIF